MPAGRRERGARPNIRPLQVDVKRGRSIVPAAVHRPAVGAKIFGKIWRAATTPAALEIEHYIL
jgi:hypothetical protein